MNDETMAKGADPNPKPKPESTVSRLRRALRNMLDNTPADAIPRSVRRQAEEALKDDGENEPATG